MVNQVTGQFECSLDDKGRFSLPSKLKEQLGNDFELVLTRAIDNCLWLYFKDSWMSVKETLELNASRFDRKAMMIQRRIVAPAENVNLDNSGRLKISSHFRNQANLEKECLLIALGDHIEIWSPQEYLLYEESISGSLEDAWSELGQK